MTINPEIIKNIERITAWPSVVACQVLIDRPNRWAHLCAAPRAIWQNAIWGFVQPRHRQPLWLF
jgi:hypothetical protein